MQGAPKERPPRWTVPIPGWAIGELDLGDLRLPSRGEIMIEAEEGSEPKATPVRTLLGITPCPGKIDMRVEGIVPGSEIDNIAQGLNVRKDEIRTRNGGVECDLAAVDPGNG